MKYNLLGAVSTIALGAAFGIGTQGAANAALTCAGTANPGDGNHVGSYTCKQTVSAPFTLTPSNNTLVLNQWMNDASAGFTQTLKSVHFSVSEILTGIGSVTNTDTVSVFGSFSSATTLTAMNGVGAPTNFLTATGFSHSTSVTGPQITLAAGASSNYSYSAFVNSGLKSVSGSLAGFIGSGTFSALVSAVMGSGGFRSTPSGNFVGGVATSAMPTIQLTYAYTTAQPPPPPSPTPEPASMALLGAGLAGLGAIRRRRKG
jgi:hypothetical protein